MFMKRVRKAQDKPVKVEVMTMTKVPVSVKVFVNSISWISAWEPAQRSTSASQPLSLASKPIKTHVVFLQSQMKSRENDEGKNSNILSDL